MEFFYLVLAIIMLGLMAIGVFILGALFCRRITTDAINEARQDRIREEYFKLAGVTKLSDPRPYTPPKTPRRRAILPYMDKLDRMMRRGKRGTIMWRAGDRRKAGI